MATVGDALAGALVSVLLEKVLKEIKLLKEAKSKFLGLEILLGILQPVTVDLEEHRDVVGSAAQKWLAKLCKELNEAENLVSEWRETKKWAVPRKRKLVKKLRDLTAENNLLRGDAAIVAYVTMVDNFDKINKESVVVTTCLRDLTSEVDRLTDAGKAVAVFLEKAFDDKLHSRDTVSEELEGITRTQLPAISSEADLGSGSGTTRSPEAMSHFNAEVPLPSPIFGGNDTVNNVKAEILSGNQRKCVGLWAMGGAGKTCTAHRVYNDSQIRSYFDGNRRLIWVTVSKRKTYDIEKELFRKLGDEGDESRDLVAVNDDLRMALTKRLDNVDKFLLVIDDVWELEQLEFIDLISEPKDSNRRVILVTTRDRKILDRKLATKIEVSLLSEDDSWKLFCGKAFGGVHKVPSALRGVPRAVAAECKKLPLALIVIGSTLAGEEDLRKWEISLKKLKDASVLNEDHEKQVFGRLQLSVDNLRGRDSRLQDCFFYFAAFPEDAEINATTDLVRLWTAEGIVGNDPDSALSPEDEAYELVGMLIALSMIEVHLKQSGRSKYLICKIHDVMRDLALYNLENNFGEGKVPACQRLCLYRPALQSETFPNDWTTQQGAHATTSTEFSVKRLSLMSSGLRQLPNQFHAPYLQVLVLNGTRLLRLPDLFVKGLTSLRVLDLHRTDLEEIPESVCNLISLVLHNLDYCRRLRKIPASIGRLVNLQQLRIVSCSSLTSLPESLRSLESLKVLDTAPPLGGDVDSKIWDHESSSGFATLQDLLYLKFLQSLTIKSDSLLQFPEVSVLTALENLRLSCRRLKELPGSFTELFSLKSLYLVSCNSLTRLPALDELQHLEKLHFFRCSELRGFPESFGRSGAFPSLRSFEVRVMHVDLPSLQRGVMPQIKSFVIFCSREVKNLPASFQFFRNLVYLEVSGCESLNSLLAFDAPNSFPYLKEIDFTGATSLQHLPAGMGKSAPNLRTLILYLTPLGKGRGIPEDLLEKERLQQLTLSVE